MKIELMRDKPVLILLKTDLRVMEKYLDLMRRIGNHMPELREGAMTSLTGLETILDHEQCEESPTANITLEFPT